MENNKMLTIESIKHRLIDKILTTNDEKLLEAIEIFFVSTQKEEIIPLSLEHIEMLAMSEEDIKKNNLITESEINDIDVKWIS